ncbi:MAG: thiamine pyrophosphate-dependent enzyme [Gammaproteobacteria bacterium]|nr:thiamine pyrophosphate-dependent enzyme [Gammaproteobacteria bacterium]MDH5618650.1 thiamine pyrophosphate-dependent enzyme [Gammaproteobacteria bacterium]
MSTKANDFLRESARVEHTLEDYAGCTPRWCTGCGDNAILAAVQRVCREEQLPLEKIVFVSGIGCSSRFPFYMGTYGFHGLHGRALPIAEGIKMRRPDLNVFVNTGDGDCMSIGTAHWVHATRYNMNMTVMMHDNNIYGLTKNQASPTSPIGTRSNTSPRGTVLQPFDPLQATLGMSNLSFVAQAPDWIPEVLYQIIHEGFKHRGFSFIRILQRCPEFQDNRWEPCIQNPASLLMLTHENGIQLSPALSRVYKEQVEHDPADLVGAREIVGTSEQLPVGILYRNPDVPCYEDMRKPDQLYTPELIKQGLDEELDKFTIWPRD